MEDYGVKATENALRATEKRIRSVYAEAQADIERKLADFTKRHQAKNARYQQMLKDGKITQSQYQSWLRGQVFQGDMWKARLDSVTQVLADTNGKALTIINGRVNGVFTENANWQSYVLERTAGLNFGFGLYDESTVNRLLREEPSLLPIKKDLDIPKDKLWNSKNITRQITQGILQGESLDKIAERLRDVTDMNINSSLTNARTAMTGAQNAGRQESLNRARKMGVKTRKEWLATLDHHTRTSHQTLDGQKVDVDKPFRIGNYTIRFPGDPEARPSMVYNCRCTMVADLVDYPSDNSQRYDNVTGKPIKNLTYKEWKQSKLPQNTVKLEFTQVGIGAAKSVADVESILNGSGMFTSMCSLTGCDLDSAKAIASSYEVVLSKFPMMRGKIGGVTSLDLGDRTYAQCYLYGNQRVEVNNHSGFYRSWSAIQRQYDHDVQVGYHPRGTTAESVLVHELGHALDGMLTNAHAMGAWRSESNYKTFAKILRAKVAQSTGVKIKDMATAVSYYGAMNAEEWFAECFAEYLTSANPRKVASTFGEMLLKILKDVNL